MEYSKSTKAGPTRSVTQSRTPLAPTPLPTWTAPGPSPLQGLAADLSQFTSLPVKAQRQAVQPLWQAATLQRAEEQRLTGEQLSVQRQLAALPQASLTPRTVSPVPAQPVTAGDWVTVMRQQAEQIDGQRLSSREHDGFIALQRQVTQTLVQGFRQDRQAPDARYAQYGEQLATLQRHPNSASVSRAVLGLIPQRERLPLQRAMDEALQRQVEQEAQEQTVLQPQALQRKKAELDEESLQPVMQRIAARRGAGNPLPAAIQRHLEQGLNHDLSRVRIHDDAEADKLSKKVNALAFTTGSDIFFQSGQFNPNTQSGLELLAHEVTHTVQQSKGGVGKGVDPDAGLESEARTMGTRLSQVPPHHLPTKTTGRGVLTVPAQRARVTGALQRAADTAAINKAITLVPGQRPEQSWLQKLGQAAWKAAYEQPIYQAGVLAGVVEGFFVDIWENVKALAAVASQAYGLLQQVFTGQITGRIEGITSWLNSLSWEGIKQIAAGLGGQLQAQILAQVKAWTQPDPFLRGRAQGKIVGMILAEVGIAYLTAGTVTAVKTSLIASGKVAQVVGKIPGAMNLIAGVNKKREAFRVLAATAKTATTQAVKKLIPEVWLKRLGSKGAAQAEQALQSADAQDALKQGGKKAKELPVAIAMAVSIAEINDTKNTPKLILEKQLLVLKTKFDWIKSFNFVGNANKFDVNLIASRIPIYAGYTALPGVVSLTVSNSLRGKILWGVQTVNSLGSPSNRIIGGHFRGIIGHPDYVVEVIGQSVVNPNCLKVKFIKKLTGNVLSNIKSPASTLFPKGWSQNDIIQIIMDVANSSTSVHVMRPDGTLEVRARVKGVLVEVLIRSGQITAAYPL